MRLLSWLMLSLAIASQAFAQAPPGPPAVGVVTVDQASITETSEFVGRIQAIQRVALTARVTAFLEDRLFTEGAEVHAGDLLYRLERPPFEADLQNKRRCRRHQFAAVERDNPTRSRNEVVEHARRTAVERR